MAEFAGLAYFAEIPAVFWNITRMGPSTGLPTRTSQGDLLFTHFLGHGRQPSDLPPTGNLQEAFEFAGSLSTFRKLCKPPSSSSAILIWHEQLAV